ncbi:MAG: hypothetical protein JWQ31_1337, partial [Mycobacterium sp.]|nr:hypothetical protein [Mycobacterium sp.]
MTTSANPPKTAVKPYCSQWFSSAAQEVRQRVLRSLGPHRLRL